MGVDDPGTASTAGRIAKIEEQLANNAVFKVGGRWWAHHACLAIELVAARANCRHGSQPMTRTYCMRRQRPELGTAAPTSGMPRCNARPR